MASYRTPDPAGLKFNRWLVLERLPHAPAHPFHWRCRCDCGTIAVIYAPNIRRGLSKSCGCLHREIRGDANRTHGQTNTREYEAWCGIKKRCYNVKTACFPNYGGRGIRVCERWRENFAAFYADMGPRPSPSHSIDRINNDGDYSPDNCRWATPIEQRQNRRKTRPYKRRRRIAA